MAQFGYAAAHEGAEDDEILEMHRDEDFFCFLIHAEGVSTHNHEVESDGRISCSYIYNPESAF